MNQSFYPLINPNIKWHEEVIPGRLIKATHDQLFLKEINETQNNNNNLNLIENIENKEEDKLQ